MAGRRRLDQVDAMRPIKQAGVVGTHTIIAFAPVGAVVLSNAALLLLHVSREAFFSISACMLTYAYAGLNRAGWRRFYWRRFVAVGIPYLCWNVIYFLWFPYVLHDATYASTPASALAHFGHQLEVGYDQLYFLIVIMEFYLVFPLVLALLRWTKGHHGLVIAAAAVAQFAMSIGMHWKLLPATVIAYGQENAACYVLYLVGGAVVAFHLSDVHDWVVRNAPLVMYLALVSAVFAEGVYFLARTGVTSALGDGSDPFQPSVIPFNVCVLGCGYLAGIFLVRPWRSRRTRAAVRIGSDNAYGIYLAQMIFITSLGALGWRDFAAWAPFWVWLPLTLAIAYFGSVALTALLARTPLAVPLTGRKQQSWRTLLPRRVPAPAAAPATAPAPAPSPVALPEPAALAGTTTDQNGT
ncbi:MAG TPA: acyltransferase [Streptosporangiaceae bacterium]|nr:acyltransferase [Streptosporangiaceae bacterium]